MLLSKLSLAYVVLSVIFEIQITSAYTWIKALKADPANPGKCVDKELGLVMNAGETWQAESYCGAFTCSPPFGDDDEYILSGVRCGDTSFGDLPPGKCVAEVDPSVDYPGCCMRSIVDCA